MERSSSPGKIKLRQIVDMVRWEGASITIQSQIRKKQAQTAVQSAVLLIGVH
jgi:hypothetical protein